MVESHTSIKRQVGLSREGNSFRLAFAPQEDILNRVRSLPFSRFDPETKTWTCAVCAQSLDALRGMYYEGMIDVSVDSLLKEDETPAPCKDADLRGGSLRRPFLVTPAMRDNNAMFSRLRAIPGGRWERKAGAMSYGPSAAGALSELVDKGMLDDPANLLTPAAVTVVFDTRNGEFKIRGDERAQRRFDEYFPDKNVVDAWKGNGLDVAFGDTFSEEVYRGEIARKQAPAHIDGIKGDLFDYQAKNVAVALQRDGFGIFDVPGLGKTLQAIAIGMELCVNRKEIPRTVCVVPGAVRTQWQQEILRFTDCEDVVVIEGDAKKRRAAYEEAETARWLIVHYDVLARDKKFIAPLISGCLLVADEAHRLKSPNAQRTKVMRQFANKAARRLALSGTPVENDPGEWFSVLSGFAIPGLFGSPIDFLNRYSYPGKFGGFEGARNLDELRERSKYHYQRHTKNEVAKHLPPLRVQTLYIDVDATYNNALRRAHREARDEIAAAALNKVKKSQTGQQIGALDGNLRDQAETGAEMTAVGMLRLMCSSPRLVAASTSNAAEAMREGGLIPDVDGPKLDELRIRVAEMQAAGERVVIFSFSKKMANLIAERFTEDGIRYVLFTGDTNMDDRNKAVTAFSTAGDEQNPGPTAFIATDAGAEGLNLGRQCSTLINVDVPWTPGRLIQRGNRIHRVDGSSESAYLVINMTLRGTLEEGILKMVERKADLSDAIFGENEGRKQTTGRRGRSVFDEAMEMWEQENETKKKKPVKRKSNKPTTPKLTDGGSEENNSS